MKPKVSIIVPLYNVEKYINRCIESLLCQTEKNIEIILVNDATPDGSMRIVREYEHSDSRIRVIDNQINQGPMWVRMQGCKACAETISAHTIPAPPFRHSTRNGESVIPAMGAKSKLLGAVKEPIVSGRTALITPSSSGPT